MPGSRRLNDLVDAAAQVLAGSRAPRAGSPQPRAEACDLVAAFFDRPRHWPALNPGVPVADAEWQAVLSAARKRASGAPLQYAVGKANFRDLTLAVDERVLIPRPETELLVDLVLDRGPAGGVAIDVGTGSGAIAIALATEGTFDRVVATDLSLDALEVARGNAERAGARVDFVHSDLLGFAGAGPRASAEFALVASNPPYIAFEEGRALPRSVRDWEPTVALFSPGNGMAVIGRLVTQAAPLLQDGGLLALEVDSRRASLAAALVARDDRFTDVSVELDLTGRERFVLGFRRRRSTHD